ncbi:MAG: hypothetical protein Q9190_005062 [Brigantiaea leucoxantha]
MDGIVSETPSLSERAQDLPLPQNGLSINGAGSPNRDSIKEEHSSDDDNCIADVQGTDEASRLKALATDVRDQDDLERNVGRQADQLLAEQAAEREQRRLEKTQGEKE